MEYGYTNGELTSITYPSGLKVTYQRVNGRIVGIDVQEPGTARKPKPVVALVSNLTHTALGQPRSWSWFSGDSAARTFDTDGRMTANEFASYIFDAAGRITGITQQLWAQRTAATGAIELYQVPITWQVGYDSRNRLTSFVRDGAQTHYTYDANSNRLTAIDTENQRHRPGWRVRWRSTSRRATSQSLNIDRHQQPAAGHSPRR